MQPVTRAVGSEKGQCQCLQGASTASCEQRGTFGSLVCRNEMVESGREAAGVVWDAGETKAHFNAAQGARQHQIVERAKMADSKHLAGESAEAGAERHVELLEDHATESIGIVSFRHHDG